jgi:mRNA interferase MazF
MARPNPKRGEVWWIDLGLAAKRRPCVVLSVPVGDRDRVLVTCVPATTSRYGSDFEVQFDTAFLKKWVRL